AKAGGGEDAAPIRAIEKVRVHNSHTTVSVCRPPCFSRFRLPWLLVCSMSQNKKYIRNNLWLKH
ncbi:hypothetical protein, partial [Flavobacterium cyanobacteriorum]|uniref:hypothetical protein n=1 Tax=Flavobacterium cyanobacteriorum TaxID=2022802 RepID=UPI001A9C4775